MKAPKTSRTRSDRPADRVPDTAGAGRDDRLKAALKANLARRKAQARARAQPAEGRTKGGADHD
ncbi:MAG: hypothetical protein HLUCCA12_00220 [Rhodobacteraceae bacterium HLUCCA12]|nr:MAG: hypothetical protein HLUCCA12_00220 [Rhodobacteraceae bacterium HLUCCA12]